MAFRRLCIPHAFQLNVKIPSEQNNTITKSVLQQRRKFLSSRRLFSKTNGRKKNEELDKGTALESLRSWTLQGLGNKGCVDGYSNSGELYEQHMQALEFSGPLKMAETASSILKDFKDAKILDAAAGSGLSGVALHNAGFSNVDAVDAAEDLLQLAESKEVYANIFQHFLGDNPLKIEDNVYDMVTLSGAIGENHLPKEAFVDLIRVVKPGGHMINVFREAASRVPWYGQNGLEGYFNELERQGKWTLIDRLTFPNFLTDMEGVVFVHLIQ